MKPKSPQGIGEDESRHGKVRVSKFLSKQYNNGSNSRPASASPCTSSEASPPETDCTNRVVTTPPGRIRVARNRVRPQSPSFKDIGFFSTHTPGHLTSPSRRPASATRPTTCAIATYCAKNASKSALDVWEISEQQKKTTYKSVVALSNRSKRELRVLLDEGLRVLTELPSQLAIQICESASANSDRNPLSSIMCDRFGSVQLKGELNKHREGQQRDEERNLLLQNLSTLITQEAKLFETGDENMKALVDTMYRMRGPSMLASLLYQHLLKVACDYGNLHITGVSTDLAIHRNIKELLQTSIEEGRKLLAADLDHATTVFETLRQNPKTSPLFLQLFSDRDTERSNREKGCPKPVQAPVPNESILYPSVASRQAIEEVIQHGSAVLLKMEALDASDILRCSEEVIPLASAICERMLKEVEVTGDEKSGLREAFLDAIQGLVIDTSEGSNDSAGDIFEGHQRDGPTTDFKRNSDTITSGPLCDDNVERSIFLVEEHAAIEKAVKDVLHTVVLHSVNNANFPSEHTPKEKAVAAVLSTAIAVAFESQEFQVLLTPRRPNTSEVQQNDRQMLQASSFKQNAKPAYREEWESSSVNISHSMTCKAGDTTHPETDTGVRLLPATTPAARLNIEVLLQNLGSLSIDGKAPRVAVHERRLRVGARFAGQQKGIQFQTIRLHKEVSVLKGMDDDEQRRGSHAWKLLPKDVSANPFIASTTKVQAQKSAAEQHELWKRVDCTQDFNNSFIQTRLVSAGDVHKCSSDVAISSVNNLPLPVLRRPSTGIARARTCTSSRPGSSHSLGPSGPGTWAAVSSDRSAQASLESKRPWSASTSVRSNCGQVQYVHPTLYTLMTYEERESTPNANMKRESVRRKSAQLPPLHSYSLQCFRAVVTLQSFFRGAKSRAETRYQVMRSELIRSLRCLRRLKQSQLNALYNEMCARDWVAECLEEECHHTEKSVDAMFQNEKRQSVLADKRAQKELEELQEAQAMAERELEEAQEAEQRIEKERSEMLSWKLKVDRCRVSYEETKKEFNLENDEDEEMLGLHHPIALREKKHYESIIKRYLKEKEEYEEARAVAARERMEATEALEHAHKERLEWQESREQALREAAEVEALVLARQFTDPRVSVKERMRTWSGDASEAPRFLANTTVGKQNVMLCLGQIVGDRDNSYAGEFTIVQEVASEEVHSAFKKHAFENMSLDLNGLKRAMREVGRRINNDEANRLVRSFDTSGDNRVQFDEFQFGLRNMFGVEMPHGLGQEVFKIGSQYVGEFYEDKRSGIGKFVTPSHYFFLGNWALGVRHGKGLVGRYTSKDRHTMLPGAVVSYRGGQRVKSERFCTGNPEHLKFFKDMLSVFAAATKRASQARRLVANEVRRRSMRNFQPPQNNHSEISGASDDSEASTRAWSPSTKDIPDVEHIDTPKLLKRVSIGAAHLYDPATGYFNSNVDFMYSSVAGTVSSSSSD